MKRVIGFVLLQLTGAFVLTSSAEELALKELEGVVSSVVVPEAYAGNVATYVRFTLQRKSGRTVFARLNLEGDVNPEVGQRCLVQYRSERISGVLGQETITDEPKLVVVALTCKR